MPDIIHKVGIKAKPSEVYKKLTTDQGLSQWWTNDVSGAGEVGSLIKFRFNGGGPDFEVGELVENSLVLWKHSGNVPEAWQGSYIRFQLREDEEQTFINFTHGNWNELSDFMGHCSMKWAVFLLSLKDLLETGEGKAFPNDIQIDHS